MSLIFPKKPLYAPMLGTLGGGSARGFGRGGGGLEAPDFSTMVTGQVFFASNYELMSVPTSASSFNGANYTHRNASIFTGGNWPAQQIDIAWSQDDPSIVRIVVSSSDYDRLQTVPLDFTASTTPVNTSDSYYLDYCRGMAMLRNGVLVTGETTNNKLVTWKMNPNGTFQRLSDYTSLGSADSIECIINPNDGAGLGDDTVIFTTGSGNAAEGIQAWRIGGDGSITILTRETTYSNSKMVPIADMGIQSNGKAQIFALREGNPVSIYQYDYNNDDFTLVQTGSSPSSRPFAVTQGWGGFMYGAYGQSPKIAKFYQNGTLQDQFSSSSLVGTSIVNSLLAIDDGTSSSGQNGNIYWTVYNGGASPERRLMRTNDKTTIGWSNSVQTNEIVQNGYYGTGGSVIGSVPRYAEADAKLASTHW
jgi:hypothetical protein